MTEVLLQSESNRSPVNWRSLFLGLIGVIFICALTPYNDYVVGNTYLVGNFLPVGVLLVLLVMIVLVNAPLSIWYPRLKLSTGELAVILAMMLVSCALPSSGLMRYLPGHLVGMWYQTPQDGNVRSLLTELNLPDWMFPRMSASDSLARANDPVVRDFMERSAVEDKSFMGYFRATPWGAWVRPAVTWGLLVSALFGAVICLSVLVRRQWAENERLAFPLASIYLSLIESPPPGRALNPLLRSRSFWLAAGLVFIIHASGALNQYFPKYVPVIPIGFNLGSIFKDPPWNAIEWGVRVSRLYFCIVGITFFLQSKIAFSLWFFYLMFSVTKMGYSSYQADFTADMQRDQIFGAVIPFALTILWVGRQSWLVILKQMLRGAKPEEPQESFLPYSIAGWGCLICLIGMVVWLVCAGASVLGATVIVLMLMMLYLVLARVVAETGLIFVQIPLPLYRPFVYALNELPAALATRTSLKTYFMGSMFHSIFSHDMRESLPPFVLHGLQVNDTDEQRPNRRKGALVAAIVLALAVGYVTSGSAMLYTEYANSSTLDRTPRNPINPYGVDSAVKWQMLSPAIDFRPPGTGPKETHSRMTHFGIGAGVTTLLSVMRLRFVSWPFHPVGYLLCYSYPMQTIWFSIFVGWLLKVFIVRFGGPEMFKNSRGFFIGLIIGEASAAAFWLLVSLACVWMNIDYRAINLLPG